MSRPSMGTHRLPRSAADYDAHQVTFYGDCRAECACGWKTGSVSLRTLRVRVTTHRRYLDSSSLPTASTTGGE